MKLHHIGIAVSSIREAEAFYKDALGMEPRGEAEEVPSESVRVRFLPAGQPRVELLEPLGPESPIAKFISKRGEGVHHLCFEVPDLESALTRLRGQGARILEPAIRIGAGGHRIAFVHPGSARGVLIELKEVRAGA